jgi:DNA (cytosine-5)-methyltransferase 1
MKNPPSIFSFFAGSGFLDLGFELSGFNIVYVNEIYAPFLQQYFGQFLKRGMIVPIL